MSKTYIATNGDTWDSIAYKVYGDEFQCNKLCEANSYHYHDVIMFEGGERVLIPDNIADDVNVIKAPWGR